MDLLIAFVVLIISVLFSLFQNFSLLIPLGIGLICFISVGLYRHYPLRSLFKMALVGAKNSLVVIRVLVLIGCLTALWRACGTISFFVVFGVKLITPHIFILVAFLLSSLVSYAMGTSFGVAGTVGVILMSIARAGGVNEYIAAGAILSGVYFGDRTAPTSSCANLVASLTKTDLYDNVKRMLKSAAFPFVICIFLYAGLSWKNPLSSADTSLVSVLENNFSLSVWTLIPAVILLILPLFRIPVRIAISISILFSFAVSMGSQQMGFEDTFHAMLFGYKPSDPTLTGILSGGGLIPMLTTILIVALSSTYSGIFNGTNMISGIRDKLFVLSEKIGRFPTVVATSILSCAVFCNQTMGIIFTHEMVGKIYQEKKIDRSTFMLDIANSTTLIAVLIPWSIASSVPLTWMGVNFKALPYAFLLYLIPLFYGIQEQHKSKQH